MLTSLNRMMGLPVVWQDQQVGFVERAVADVSTGRVAGVVMRKGIGAARWMPADGILTVGKRCLLLNRPPKRMPRGEPGRLTRAFLTTGECVGEVTDTLVDGATLRLLALEVSPGPVYRLAGIRAYADRYRVSQTGQSGDVVLARLLTWAQLLNTLGEEDGG